MDMITFVQFVQINALISCSYATFAKLPFHPEVFPPPVLQKPFHKPMMIYQHPPMGPFIRQPLLPMFPTQMKRPFKVIPVVKQKLFMKRLPFSNKMKPMVIKKVKYIKVPKISTKPKIPFKYPRPQSPPMYRLPRPEFQGNVVTGYRPPPGTNRPRPRVRRPPTRIYRRPVAQPPTRTYRPPRPQYPVRSYIPPPAPLPPRTFEPPIQPQDVFDRPPVQPPAVNAFPEYQPPIVNNIPEYQAPVVYNMPVPPIVPPRDFTEPQYISDDDDDDNEDDFNDFDDYQEDKFEEFDDRMEDSLEKNADGDYDNDDDERSEESDDEKENSLEKKSDGDSDDDDDRSEESDDRKEDSLEKKADSDSDDDDDNRSEESDDRKEDSLEKKADSDSDDDDDDRSEESDDRKEDSLEKKADSDSDDDDNDRSEEPDDRKEDSREKKADSDTDDDDNDRSAESDDRKEDSLEKKADSDSDDDDDDRLEEFDDRMDDSLEKTADGSSDNEDDDRLDDEISENFDQMNEVRRNIARSRQDLDHLIKESNRYQGKIFDKMGNRLTQQTTQHFNPGRIPTQTSKTMGAPTKRQNMYEENEFEIRENRNIPARSNKNFADIDDRQTRYQENYFEQADSNEDRFNNRAQQLRGSNMPVPATDIFGNIADRRNKYSENERNGESLTQQNYPQDDMRSLQANSRRFGIQTTNNMGNFGDGRIIYDEKYFERNGNRLTQQDIMRAQPTNTNGDLERQTEYSEEYFDRMDDGLMQQLQPLQKSNMQLQHTNRRTGNGIENTFVTRQQINFSDNDENVEREQTMVYQNDNNKHLDNEDEYRRNYVKTRAETRSRYNIRRGN
ncbi:uncharacterized protein DDB_G0283697-like [Mercenaria mercenaria]|uniref:uncharacterized protein DDB_G0283697-like n=1 Tax=Mercenaria mercenaria TaxID=6596 RepID=UPI00234EDEAF|nr:uncharacterized protein DDB_G0283697-like [Mercenaria mercenaria]